MRSSKSSSSHFVSFFTEGTPFDLGPNLSDSARRLGEMTSKVFDTSTLMSPRQLLDLDTSWAQQFENYTETIRLRLPTFPTVKWNPAWAKLGLFAWKPRLILEKLLDPEVAFGDIVFYHDSDVGKYPDYLLGIKRWPKYLARQLVQADIVIFRDNRATFVSDTKPELWRKFFDDDEVKLAKHLWAGALGVKKTPESIEFISQWNHLASDPENLLPFSAATHTDGFVQHSPDQAILACLSNYAALSKVGPKIQAVYLYETRRIPPPTWKVLKSRSRRFLRRIGK